MAHEFKKPVIGQECLCPDGMGRIAAYCDNFPDQWIQVDTYVNNRSCKWAPHNVVYYANQFPPLEEPPAEAKWRPASEKPPVKPSKGVDYLQSDLYPVKVAGQKGWFIGRLIEEPSCGYAQWSVIGTNFTYVTKWYDLPETSDV